MVVIFKIFTEINDIPCSEHGIFDLKLHTDKRLFSVSFLVIPFNNV